MTELKRLQSHVSLLIMSRPISNMESILKEAVHINVEANATDISNYLQQRLDTAGSMKKHLREEPTLRDTIISRISRKTKGIYVVNFRTKHRLHYADTLPRSLIARLYLNTLVHKITRQKIKKRPRGITQNPRFHLRRPNDSYQVTKSQRSCGSCGQSSRLEFLRCPTLDCYRDTTRISH